ncbi:BrnT family toxin [bacterium]|nr:BrnT family toxin [bacterium]
MTGKELFNECAGFDWDKNNIEKNWEKHKVTPFESEQVFFNRPLWVADDIKHTDKESRFYALGKTDSERLLFIAFTIRNKKIRVISSRDMNKKERIIYEKKDTQKNSEIQE